MKRIINNRKIKIQKNRLKNLEFFQLLVFALELILLAGVLLVIINKLQGGQALARVIETPTSDVKILPPDVKREFEGATLSTSFRIPILMYHYVEFVQDRKDLFRQSLNIEPGIFSEQIRTLQDAGYTFLTAGEFAVILDGKANLPENPVMITVDDGHWDLYTDIMPILKKYNVKATAYIVPGLLGGSDFLSSEQLRAVIDSGLIEIGAHTVHHYSLPKLSPDELRFEITQSKEMLEKTYGVMVKTFAYPNGAFNVRTVEVVRDSDFLLAVSTIPGIEQSEANRYFLNRLRPGKRVGKELLDWLQQDTFSAFGE